MRLPSVTIASLAAVSVATAQTGRVSGTVYDSVAGRPLTRAMVQLVDRDDPAKLLQAESDARGEFRFESVPDGRYVLGFFHEALDALGLNGGTNPVQVSAGSAARVPLAIPSRRTIVTLVCGEVMARTGAGLWIGTIRSAVTRQPVGAGRIAAEWSQLRAVGTSVEAVDFAVEDTASAEGRFAICGPPPDESIYARAVSGTDSSGILTFFAPGDAFVHQDVYVGPSVTRELAIDSIRRIPFGTWGTGRLRGNIRRASGGSVAGARVVFGGREQRSGDEGAFVFDSLPLGTHTLEVRALGFVPERRLVHVLAPDSGPLPPEEIRLESREVFLDTVQVVGQRVYMSPRYKQFLERKTMGIGRFLDEADLEKKRASYVADYMRGIPGVFVFQSRGIGGQRIAMRASRGGYCSPNVFVDGMRMRGGAQEIEGIVTAHQIQGIEVYTRAGMVPMEFHSLSECGAIAIWTGPRRVRPPDPEKKKP